MHVLVFGGSGRSGRLIIEELITRGHIVSAAGRRHPMVEQVHTHHADLTRAIKVQQLAEGKDAVISALASGKNNPVCSTVARALSLNDDLRFISIGGAGVDAPGDQKGPSDRCIGWVMRKIVPELLSDRQLELEILQKSSLCWTMLRPPMLINTRKQSVVKMTYDRPVSTAISRLLLAKAAVDALEDASLFYRAPFVSASKQ